MNGLNEREQIRYKYKKQFAEWVIKTAKVHSIEVTDNQRQELYETGDEPYLYRKFFDKGLGVAWGYEKYSLWLLPLHNELKRLKRQNMVNLRRTGYINYLHKKGRL